MIIFLLLALAGLAMIVAGIYLLAGMAWAVIASGIVALVLSAVAYRAAYS